MKDEETNTGMLLLTKGKRGIFKTIFSRSGLILILLAAQVLLLFAIFRWFTEFLPHIYGGVLIFTLFMVLYLLSTPMDPTAKLSWLIIELVMPVFGALLFIYTKNNIGHGALKKRYAELNFLHKEEVPQKEDVVKELSEKHVAIKNLSSYVAKTGTYPIYKNTDVTYFPLGEDKFRAMIPELEKAKDFIFLEYFIITEGKMWGEILDILARKAKEGVDVRLLYDGTCELSTLPHDYPKRIRKLGIKCKMFAPIKPFVSTHYNYRDHRKILVIDGQVAFNGGVNLADEYINEYVKYGHWKDTAVMVKGEAVKSFTRMFLHMWNLDEKVPEFDSFLSKPSLPVEGQGYVMPYGDNPLDDDKVGEMVYIDILNRSEKYCYIMTPYLILDSDLENTLKYTAKRGVDVRIILPGIPDKYVPFSLALTHYKSLLDSGVKIYEYTPGFVHAKVFVSDDREGVVGTINLDYRSLYHHFECATYMYETSCIGNLKKDFLETQDKCRCMTKELAKKEPFKRRFLGFFAKALAPLM